MEATATLSFLIKLLACVFSLLKVPCNNVLEELNKYQDKAFTLHRITPVPLLPPCFELAGLRSLRIHADTTLATELLKVFLCSSVNWIHFPIQTLLLGSDMWPS